MSKAELVISALAKAILAEAPTDDIAEALYTWPSDEWTEQEAEAVWHYFKLADIAKRQAGLT